ncbi:MAG: hypothetical protein L6R45_09590 [Anaerolineae bacterium]|nr:hypothetical protein [Anaerolineae bacterium]
MINKKVLWGAILGLGLVSLLAWFFATHYETARRVVFMIPPGVGAGQVALNIPDEIVLTLGVKDTLVIENQDEVMHTFGPFVVPPHSTITHRFYHAVNYQGVCTFHQERQMKLVVKPAPWQLHFFYSE